MSDLMPVLMMRTKNTNQPPIRRTNSTVVLGVMIAAGLARIAMSTMGDFQPASPSHGETHDPATIRRNLQLVTSSLQALLARYGFAVVSGDEDCALEAPAWHFRTTARDQAVASGQVAQIHTLLSRH